VRGRICDARPTIGAKQRTIARLAREFFQPRAQPSETLWRRVCTQRRNALAAVLRLADAQPLAPWLKQHIVEVERQYLTDPHPRLAQQREYQAVRLRRCADRCINSRKVAPTIHWARQPPCGSARWLTIVHRVGRTQTLLLRPSEEAF
jgi:hypothetical protein